jgi:hypothetical protein
MTRGQLGLAYFMRIDGTIKAKAIGEVESGVSGALLH